MKTKAYQAGAVILAVLVSLPALAADPLPQPPANPAQPTTPLPDVLPTPTPAAEPPATPAGYPARPDGLPVGSVPSPWITYTRPDCCGPLGGGPIGFEYYLRTGPSIPVSTGILHETLDTGWFTEIGARSLFFNPPTTAAWTLDLGLSYTWSNGNRSDLTYQVPLLTGVQDPVTGQVTPTLQNVLVTTRDYQRWSLNLAFGRERYLIRPAYEPGWHWRAGWDVGGRWGYGRLDLNDLTNLPNIGFVHHSDVFGAVALALHEDIEIPLGNCVSFIAGIRGEWVYNWTDVVPPEAGRDLQDVNILLNFGWRY